MKKQFLSILSIIIFATFSSLALATDDGYGDGGYNDPCGGNQCQPESYPYQSVTVGGGSYFAGFVGSQFTGQEGYNVVEKNGYGGTDITLNAAGSGCGSRCQGIDFTFTGYAGEHVKTATGAWGDQSGVPVTAVNEGGTIAEVNFNFNKDNIVPAQQ